MSTIRKSRHVLYELLSLLETYISDLHLLLVIDSFDDRFTHGLVWKVGKVVGK